MGKHLLAFACLLFPAMVTQTDDGPGPEITLDPLPPTQGGQMTIGYTGAPGTTLELDWDPPGTPATVTIPASGKVTITVPDNATSLVVSDPTPGGAPYESTVISPGP